MFLFLTIAVLVVLFNTVKIVSQQSELIVERFGKFHKVLPAGLHVIVPFVDRVAYTASLRINQLETLVETKTRDNVFVSIPVVIQYRIVDSYKSFYTLSNHVEQIRSYVFD